MPLDGSRIKTAERRAYATLTIKVLDESLRTFEGIASTATPDRVGDIVEPRGAEFTLPLPLLYQHDAERPIGQVTDATVTNAGIRIKGRVEKVDGPPTLKERLDVAWAEMKLGLVRGLSIGFLPIESAQIEGSWGLHFTEWEWLELSPVTIPANAEATITVVKRLDAASARATKDSSSKTTSAGNDNDGSSAASGTSSPPVPVRLKPSPGVSGFAHSKGQAMTGQERITSWENKRAATVAAMGNLMKVAEEDDGRALNADEGEEYDKHASEVGQIDEQIKRLKQQEQFNKAAAVAVPASAGDDPDHGSKARAGIVLKPNANLPKGMGMARYVKALAYAKGNYQQATEYAKQWDTSTPEVGLALKAAIAAGTTADSAWAGPLVYNQNLVDEFVEFLRPQTILGKMDGFRRVPFNVRFPTQTGGSTMGWVGEGAAKPVSKLQLSSGTLGFAKCAGIVVVTMELARFSSPSAELLVRDDLTAQSIQFLDAQFIDPGVAAVANTNPASITNGAGNVVQSSAVWNTQANVIADIKTFLQAFAANNIALDRTVYWIMTPAVAISLSMITTANGVYAFPDVGVNGGTLFGIPVITSNSVPSSVSAGAIVALVKASEVFLADDNQVAIDVSQEASLQMDSAPTESASVPTATSVVSMFQTNSLAIRAERVINWARRRSYGAGYIDNVHTS